MKVNGRRIDRPNEEVVVIPRADGDIVFKARAILSYEGHESIDPVPKPMGVMRPGGVMSHDVENPAFKKLLNEWSTRRYYWMIIKSLEATEGLEWDTVDSSKPETWANWRKDLETSGFSMVEISRIEAITIDACGLNQSKIDEATKRFLAGQVRRNGVSSPSSEQNITLSGELVNASN